jgi:outer membrane murein-binding lipoprotein Lpp
MKLFRLTLAAVFIVAFTMIGCSEDETSSTGTEDVNASNVCSQELCAANAALKQECETFMQECLAAVGEGREDECVGGGWLICKL